MNKMISSLSLFFVLFSLSSAAIISVEMSNFKAILLDRLPYPFYKLTSTTRKSIDSSNYSTTKQASTSQKATDSSSVKFFEKSDATTKSKYTTVKPPNSTDKYSYSSKNYTNLKPTNSSVYATTKSAFTSQTSTDSPVKYSYSSVSIDKTFPKGTSCADYFLKGYNLSGVYPIYPLTMYETYSFRVFCDMQTNGGGWTVIQRRGDYEPQENFTRNWNEYKNGFGRLNRDFWLGNDHLSILTNRDDVELRVDLEDFKGNKKWAQYSQFRIQDKNYSYKLSISGYKGDAGDSLYYHNNTKFATYDKDTNKCANRSKGGWWYHYCWQSNLNGLYFKTNAPDAYQGTAWYTWEDRVYSLKKTEMKIRPTNFLST